MNGIQVRSIPKSIIFSFITCGIYGIYWFIKMTNEVHTAAGRKSTASGGLAFLYCLITCGIYFFYWVYKMGQTIIEAKESRNMTVDGNLPIIYVVFALFGLAIVSEALIQDALNDICAYDDGQQRSGEKRLEQNRHEESGSDDQTENTQE